MKIEIRKSFIKDAEKMTSPNQHQLAVIIAEMEKANTPAQLNNCKKLTGYKTAYRIRMGRTVLGFIMKTR